MTKFTNQIVGDTDRSSVRTGEIAVEWTEHDGQGFPSSAPQICRFRSYARAQKFAQELQAIGHSVKAWEVTGDDTSSTVTL